MTCASPRFLPLSGIFEPSAILQLSDGRFLVVEDEKRHPFSLVTLQLDGRARSFPLRNDTATDPAARKLDDLEGLTLDPSGWIYAITSHSRNGEGEEKKSRDRLVRFRIDGDQMAEPTVVKGLKAALTAAHPVLAAAAAIRNVKGEGGLNIEALEIDPERHQLLLGFRSPLQDNRAIIACLENFATIFDAAALPRVAPELVTLDLGGQGIRALSHIPALGGYLIVSGPIARERVQFQLWFWNGRRGTAAHRVSVPGLPGFEHAEGVTHAVIDDQPCIVIVSDDGSREENRYARFLLLDIGQVRIETESSPR